VTLLLVVIGLLLALGALSGGPDDNEALHQALTAIAAIFSPTPSPPIVAPVLLEPPTETPSVTASATGTPTATASPTEPHTPTATATLTETPTEVPSAIASATETPSPTATETPTASPTPTATLTETPTATQIPVPSPTPADAEVKVTIAMGGLSVGKQAEVDPSVTTPLNLRTGPGTNYAITGQVPSGTSLTLLAGPQTTSSYVWWQVRLPDGQTGWLVEAIGNLPALRVRPEAYIEGHAQPLALVPVQVAEQTFERGRMFWLADKDIILVLVNDGRWMEFPNTWREGELIEDRTLRPPAGRQQPILGFGKLWRNNNSVRDALGWAVRAETSYFAPYAENSGSAVRIIVAHDQEGLVLYTRSSAWTLAGTRLSPRVAPTPARTPTVTPVPAQPTAGFDSNLAGWMTKGDGGRWLYTSEGLLGAVAGGTDSFYVSYDAFSDLVYEAHFTMLEGEPEAAAGMLFGCEAEPLDGCYMVRVSAYNTGEITLTYFYPYRRYRQIARDNRPIAPNIEYRIRVEIAGASIAVYLDDTLIFAILDNAYRGGRVGLNVNGSTTLFKSAVAYGNDAPQAAGSQAEPTPATSDRVPFSENPCPGFMAPRLAPGMQARVTDGAPNNIREQIGSRVVLGQIPPGGVFRVLSGPECPYGAQNVWYRVEYAGIVGWTAEGYDGIYWLEALASPTELQCALTSTPFSSVWESVKAQIGCPTGPSMTALVAEERFERGYMFWREPIDTSHALVAFDRGSWVRYYHRPYSANDPEFLCVDSNTPPQCPPTPKRGFGMMWCNIPEIRSGLGNARTCERGFQGTLQEFDNGFMLGSDQGQVFVFYHDGRWEIR